jgi:hypothetical protein
MAITTAEALAADVSCGYCRALARAHVRAVKRSQSQLIALWRLTPAAVKRGGGILPSSVLIACLLPSGYGKAWRHFGRFTLIK